MADLSKLDANKSNAKTHSKTSPVAALAKSPMPVHDLPIPDFVGQPLIEAIAALHAASTTAGVGGGLPYVVEDGAIGGPAVAPPFNGQHYVTDQSPPYSPNGVSVSVMHFAVEERCTTPMPTILPKVDGIPCDQGMAAIDATIALTGATNAITIHFEDGTAITAPYPTEAIKTATPVTPVKLQAGDTVAVIVFNPL
jgi:hypothetical protein